MNVLVSGGAGYVGGAVTDLLATTEHKVRVFDSLVYEESYRKPVDFVYGDVRDSAALQPQLDWADAVIWLAALVGDAACAVHPEISKQVNEDAAKYLAEHFGGRIIFMSTCSVYGAHDRELDETSPTRPLSIYAATKLAAEQHLQGKDALVFRLGTLFGVSDLFSRIRFDLVVNVLTLRAYRDGHIQVFGGDQFRPLLHVRDAARAAVENLATKPTGVFNLARQNVRILDLAYQVRNHFPDVKIEKTDMKFEDLRNYRARCDKARDVLDFKPRGSIDEGIDEIKGLLETRRLKDVNNPRYSNDKFLAQGKP